MAVLLLQLQPAAAQATETWWLHQRCLSAPPNPANGSFPGASYGQPRHGSRPRGCRGMPSGAWCLGRCNTGFTGMPMVKCWKGAWQPIEGGCKFTTPQPSPSPSPSPQPSPPTARPCGSPGDDYCAAIPRAINGSCAPVPPSDYTCKCVPHYAWNAESQSCVASLGFAVGTQRARGYQGRDTRFSAVKPAILMWNGTQWDAQALPAGLPSSLRFTSVAFTSPTTAYAAGSVPGTGPGYLLKWDGAAWSIQQNGSSPLQIGVDPFVASSRKGDEVVTLGSSPGDASKLISTSGPYNASGGAAWKAWPVAADISSPGAVTALIYIRDFYSRCSNSSPMATTQHQLVQYSPAVHDIGLGDCTWMNSGETPYATSYTALAGGCCNPLNVWVAATHPTAPASIGTWSFYNYEATSQPLGSASPPFAQGYAFNHVSASDGVTAWAIGAGLPDAVGVILGCNNKTESWAVAFDGRKVTPNLPPLRGSYTLDKFNAVAVGDDGAVVWWNGAAWKPAESLSGGLGVSSRYDLQAVALYGPCTSPCPGCGGCVESLGMGGGDPFWAGH